MATIFDIEMNPDGSQKRYRLRHKNPAFAGGFPGVVFVDGVSADPVQPRVLRRLLALVGEDLELVPVDDEPVAAHAAPTVLSPALDTSDASDVVEHLEAVASCLPDNIEALRAIAASRGIPVDGRWGKVRIRKALEAAAC